MIDEERKVRYTLSWCVLINKFNGSYIGEISQRRLAELFNTTDASISLDQTQPRTKEHFITKYSFRYHILFSEVMPFEDLFTKHLV